MADLKYLIYMHAHELSVFRLCLDQNAEADLMSTDSNPIRGAVSDLPRGGQGSVYVWGVS